MTEIESAIQAVKQAVKQSGFGTVEDGTIEKIQDKHVIYRERVVRITIGQQVRKND